MKSLSAGCSHTYIYTIYIKLSPPRYSVAVVSIFFPGESGNKPRNFLGDANKED